MLRRVRFGATEEKTPVRDVGVAGPDLLAIHDQRVPLPLGARAERRQVGARPRLGESLAPQLLPREEGTDEAAPLRFAAVPEESGADQIDVRRGRWPWGAHLVERLVEEPAFDGRGGAASVLARPGDGSPATVVEEALPGARDLEPHRLLDPRPAVVSPPGRREVRFEPGARLLREAELRAREGEIHAPKGSSRRPSPPCGRGRRRIPRPCRR